jgi:hypothetical protein
LRSDGAPSLSQAIVPTWTAAHTFTPTQAANTTVNSLILADTTTASSGNQQFSPSIRLTGQGWETGTTASQAVDWQIENDPVQGATNPSTNLIFNRRINGGSYASGMTLSSTGITFGNTTDNATLQFLGSGAVTFGTGTTQYGGNLIINAAAPEFRFYNSGGAADGKYWRDYVSAAVLNYGIFTDGGSSPKNYFAITRSADVITDVSIGNATDNNTVTFLGNGAVTLAGAIKMPNLLSSPTAPTISSGFGTSPSVTHNNGTASFSINVGTGGSATSGVVGLPTASNAWACSAADTGTTPTGQTEQTATSTTTATLTNYSRTTGLAAAWTASEIIQISCWAN